MKAHPTLTPRYLLLVALLLCSGAALAEQPGSDWLPAPQLLQKLDAQGFRSARDLKPVRGHWEGEAFQNGAIVIFHANAQTGQVTFQKAKDNAGHGH